MRVVLYEFVTGGGWLSQSPQPPPASLLREGRAMVAALAADLVRVAGVVVDVLSDVRLGQASNVAGRVHVVDSPDAEARLLAERSAEADWTIVIAPEFDGLLFERSRVVERAGGRLLGASSALAGLAADKQATAEFLAARGVSVPHGVALRAGQALPDEFVYPAVLKPRDGAGSQGVQLIAAAAGRAAPWPARLEEYCPGTPASVALLCGPAGQLALEPCLQRLGGASGFEYLGGKVPLSAEQAARARRLAAHAAAALPDPLGYLGVDLILGDDPAGSGDRAIEVNPRLTTSYVGLRALCTTNLANALLATAKGCCVQLSWRDGSVVFEADGAVRREPRA